MRILSNACPLVRSPSEAADHNGAWARPVRRPAGWRARALASGLAAVVAASLVLPVGAQSTLVRGVFEVMVLAQVAATASVPAHWVDFREGTAFFTGPDGIALTDSHVVYPAHEDPRNYQLLAVLNGEFYGASVICASELPQGVMGHAELVVRPRRDLAEIHLSPPHFQFNELSHGGIRYAVAHRGPLPAFPSLEAGPDPSIGDSVRVVSYGRFGTQFPHALQDAGTVSGFARAKDGTRLVAMKLGADPEPGASGSPVINVHNQVIGIFAWGYRDSGLAMTRRGLDPICR